MDEDKIVNQIEKAREAWTEATSLEPQAKTAYYDADKNLVVITLTSGAEFLFPPELIEGLGNVSEAELKDVHLSGSGRSIHWESLDADFSIVGLVSGILGTKRWMSELGKQGGKKVSDKKALAAKQNGKKGGRPKGSTKKS